MERRMGIWQIHGRTYEPYNIQPMRTLIIGSVLFLIWIVLSTVCFLTTRGFLGQDARPAEVPVVEALPEVPEPEPAPESARYHPTLSG